MARKTSYSWIAVSVDAKKAPITGHWSDDATNFWATREVCESMLRHDPYLGTTEIAAVHILDAYGRVVWTGYPNA